MCKEFETREGLMILAGDIGGTKTRLALFHPEEKDYQPLYFSVYFSKEHPSLSSIVLKFLEECRKVVENLDIQIAAFAIAGPVQFGMAYATNLSWKTIDTKDLSRECNISQVYLLNDLEANAYGIEILNAESLHILHEGRKNASGNRGVCSPGTGLGEAGIFWDGKHYHPFACEGGHCEFGPTNALQIELCHYLIEKFGHTSYERILSGPGIYTIYSFLKKIKKFEEPTWLESRFQKEDPTKIISELGLNKELSICAETLDLFTSIFGAEAGNLALKLMATGGIYLGGGIPPKILPKLKEGQFIESFCSKGRFRSFLSEIPITVILDDKATLKGAAHFCRHIVD